jgi:hypothetical protein
MITMQRRHRTIARVAIAATALTTLTVLASVSLPALAATRTMTMSYAANATTPTGTVGGLNVSAGSGANDQGGFGNMGIPWAGAIVNGTNAGATVAQGAGVNRLMSNFWNPDVSASGQTGSNQELTVDDQTGAYRISNFVGNTYFPNGRPNSPCTGGDLTNVNAACHWTARKGFPANYPALYKGCHFTQCSVSVGQPYPMTLNSLVSLDSTWNVTLPNAGVGVFDVAYDIWLDRGVSPALPANAALLNQNDGAEIMLWINNHGYGGNTNTTTIQNPITPAGTKLPVTYTDSKGQVWDVWVGRQDPNGARPWNIVTYVKQVPTTTFAMDTKEFLDDSLSYNSAARPSLAATLNSICPAQNDGTVQGQCVSPSWWLTSVQTGFEVWNLPTDGGASQGGALGTTQFSVKPLSVLANDPAGVTGRARAGNSPIIHWNDQFTIKYASCVGAGTGTYTITPGTGTPPVTGTLTESPAGSGIYTATAGPLVPGHDGSSIAVSIPCAGGADAVTKPVFIDPSGHVQTTNGLDIQGATVQLLRDNTAGQNGTPPFPLAPNDGNVIQPPNNTQTTDTSGAFRWDVVAGRYQVRASAPGCNTVTTGVLPVPPPQVDLLLKLTCAGTAPGLRFPKAGGGTVGNGGGGGGLPTTVVVRPPGVGQFGYCADVTVTNNTAQTVTWNTSFTVPGNQRINQMWNMTLTQVGNQATNVHADPKNPWNLTLKAGESTHDIGFCAVP